MGDIDEDAHIVTIRRQTFPGAGGLVTKQTKGRDIRRVPILEPLAPVLQHLTTGREPDERLLTGLRGGVLTTATVRDATRWDAVVADLGLPNLTRHGLRHTGATCSPTSESRCMCCKGSSGTSRGRPCADTSTPITGTSPTPPPSRRVPQRTGRNPDPGCARDVTPSVAGAVVA